MNEIKQNAPKGATHYKEYNGEISYFRKSNNLMFFFNDGKWCVTYRYAEYQLKPL